jgi:hypothetical protein
MTHRNLILSLATTLAIAATAVAQDDAKSQHQMPNPKHEQHAALAPLCGDWEFTYQMAAMPGVPGMEKPSEGTGREQVAMVCNGIWLKSNIQSEWQGQPFTGTWLAGYDPFGKQYVSYWVSSDPNEPGISKMTGSFDAKTKTWAWAGKTSHGDTRSEFVFHGDSSVETSWVKGADGKETQTMQITRKRTKGASARDASASKAATSEGVGKEHEALHRDVGSWDAVVKTAMPGAPASEDRGAETVSAICNGRWTWSDFQGAMMGMPYEGHCLVGYDEKQQKYLSLWIDSMSPTAAETSGTFDAKKSAVAMAGNCLCPEGKPMQITQTVTHKDANTRHNAMMFTMPEGASTMEITYTRKSAK